MAEHYSAWITVTADCLENDFCDVTVLRDEIAGYREDANGEEYPDWTSTGETMFTAALPVRHDEEDQDVRDTIVPEAIAALKAAGWEVQDYDGPHPRTGEVDGEWTGVPTGLVAAVARI